MRRLTVLAGFVELNPLIAHDVWQTALAGPPTCITGTSRVPLKVMALPAAADAGSGPRMSDGCRSTTRPWPSPAPEGRCWGVLHLSLIRRKPSAIDRAPHALALNLVRMLGLSAGDAGQVAARRLPRAR